MQWLNEKESVWMDIVMECIGSFLVAIAIYNFALRAEFPMTGFSGIALILYRLFGAPIGITTIIINIPVAILCYRLIGKKFMIRTFRCMIISSFMIDYVAPLLPLYEGNRMLAAIVTGVIGGIGYAIIYTRNSSTGGSDFLIMAAKAIRPHMKLGTIAFLSDIGIILVGGVIFHDVDGVIYGMIINFLFAIAVDKVMSGMNSGKIALIVTKRGEEICDIIDSCCGRGSTILDGRGGYKKDEKQVVMVACNPKQLVQVEKAVKEVDEEVFIIHMDANEIHGEGFRVVPS
ncbi:YitT family protein [Anaerosporobacter faecicola]|uniref:YitT family protein n=1 Tax=Anaerosporobacter faecicola TaxID=2718714 RepID=UPI00143A424A|nr:YitT family protein [Anaerosporobacter faecicola]